MKTLAVMEKFLGEIKERTEKVRARAGAIVLVAIEGLGRTSVWHRSRLATDDEEFLKLTESINEEALDTARIALHPTRLRILLYCLKPRSESELEKLTGLRGGGLYHHLRELAFHRLLEKTERGKYKTTAQGTYMVAVALCLPFEGSESTEEK